MLKLDELNKIMKGEFFLQEELKKHGVRKLDALADIIIKPAGKKDLATLLHFLEESGYPHLFINSKGRVVFPDKRFHGAIVVSDYKVQ